jgi:hypothetical protein
LPLTFPHADVLQHAHPRGDAHRHHANVVERIHPRAKDGNPRQAGAASPAISTRHVLDQEMVVSRNQ